MLSFSGKLLDVELVLQGETWYLKINCKVFDENVSLRKETHHYSIYAPHYIIFVAYTLFDMPEIASTHLENIPRPIIISSIIGMPKFSCEITKKPKQ